LLWLGGCSLTFPSRLQHFVEADPVLPESATYYLDPIDSSLVWSLEGVQVKVKFYNDEMLDAEYDPRYSPYTLTGWTHPELGYIPPLRTVFDITLINRTRDRVELDPTQGDYAPGQRQLLLLSAENRFGPPFRGTGTGR